MRELGRLLLLLLVTSLALLCVALIRFNTQPVLLQLGVRDLPRWPVGWLVAGALGCGILVGLLLCGVRLASLRLRLRRVQREQRALQDELRRVRSLPLRITADVPPAEGAEG